MHVNLVDLVNSFPMKILLQNLASIQKRTGPIKFAHLAEKSANGSISNLSTKPTTVQVMQCAVERARPWHQFRIPKFVQCGDPILKAQFKLTVIIA